METENRKNENEEPGVKSIHRYHFNINTWVTLFLNEVTIILVFQLVFMA